MGLRQRQWAKAARLALIQSLGGRCAWCGTTEHLTCDCIAPMGHEHHERYDPSWRVSFYRAQAAVGNLQVLCDACNTRKGATELPF